MSWMAKVMELALRVWETNIYLAPLIVLLVDEVNYWRQHLWWTSGCSLDPVLTPVI